MIRFNIHAENVAGPWIWQCPAWVSGSSWITPLQFSILTATLTRNADATELHVAENRPGGDWTRITLSTTNGSISLRAAAGGTAPLYLATDGDRLFGSWDPVDLTSFAYTDALSPAVVARLLTRRHRRPYTL